MPKSSFTTITRLFLRSALLLLITLFLGIETTVWKLSAARDTVPAQNPTTAIHLPFVISSYMTPTRTAIVSPIPMSTSTQSPATTPTIPPTKTDIAIASPTPTMPNTGLGDCGNVYPIRIEQRLIGAQDFLPPETPSELEFYLPYSDPMYGTHWQRRVYYRGTELGFVRWLAAPSAGNAVALSHALTGTGTLAEGFDEVIPWPASNVPPPPDYPVLPHRLNVGDWLYYNDGTYISKTMRDAFTFHQQQRTVMNLPITTPIYFGFNSSTQMQRFGAFLLNGFGSRNGYDYFDLVYLGASKPVPCSAMN